ncbi:MAG: tetratricopeptide repeat protein, partial [Candidatus Hydrothermarchaeales archaeon]
MAKYALDRIGWSHSMKMGHRCAGKGDYVASIEHYLQALNGGSDHAALIYNNLADSYMNTGQLDLAMEQAKEAISRAQDKTLPYVTLGEIHQARGEHEKAVECIRRAREMFEELMPEMKDALFDSIEEVIKKLPTREKFEVASKDWVRIIYLVKYTVATNQM